ncbi:MAG: hypothetical protein OEU92_02660 [Alphaproteobacteria bacterium]|nr:hypothetical protein [Alphaproteobacteria bacterium]
MLSRLHLQDRFSVCSRSSRAWLASQWHTPLYRNANALAFSSAMSSVLGLVFWVIAARLYETEVVGIAGAMLAAMMFIANVASLNLAMAIQRFLPTVGGQAPRLVLAIYGLVMVTSILVLALFVLGASYGMQALGFAQPHQSMPWLFAVATVAWCIFTLQDAVLTGLRQAVWVPIENILFNLVKIGLLIGFAASLPENGILASWTLGVLLTILPVNWLIFAKLMPATSAPGKPIDPRHIARFAGLDYVGSWFAYAAIDLTPMLVVWLLGAAANAYYFLSWSIVYALYLINSNIGSSLVVEGARHPGNLAPLAKRALGQNLLLVTPIVLVLMVASPYILWLFGPEYADNAAALVRVLALSALPQIIVAIYLSVIRVEGRMGQVVLVEGALALIVLGGGIVMMRAFGLMGIGYTWLAAQTLLAVLLLAFPLRRLLVASG